MELKMKTALVLIVFWTIFQNGNCITKDINFEDVAKEYVDCVEQSTDLKSTWWSLTGKHEFFELNERFKIYKIKVYRNNTFQDGADEVFEHTVEKIAPDQVEVNDGPTEKTVAFKEISRHHDSVTSFVPFNVKFNGIEVWNPVENGSFSESEIRGSQFQTMLKRDLTVRPHSEVTISAFLHKKRIKRTLIHEFVIEGCITIAFSDYVGPRRQTNYKDIKDVSDEKYWENCGAGYEPEASRKGVYILPIGGLEDNVEFKGVDDANQLCYQVTEIKDIQQERVHYEIHGKKLQSK